MTNCETNEHLSEGGKLLELSQLDKPPQEIVLRLSRVSNEILDHHDSIVAVCLFKYWKKRRKVKHELFVLIGEIGGDDDGLHQRISGEA